ncbi:hypothetical protein [Litoribacter ruber]|uniref:hypothetical protein n=1 Tax=Litoribacter ruber TaxID=702568 RepID=UPI001BD362A2|nr:hypothetical protein [Litoribacter alkaliphilus]
MIFDTASPPQSQQGIEQRNPGFGQGMPKITVKIIIPFYWERFFGIYSTFAGYSVQF